MIHIKRFLVGLVAYLIVAAVGIPILGLMVYAAENFGVEYLLYIPMGLFLMLLFYSTGDKILEEMLDNE